MTPNKVKIDHIYTGDCLEVMKDFPDNSIDSIVTDPPYGLEFMGKEWDSEVPPVVIWEQCLRVLKPGGHLLSFAGTRTQHRMATNIENAGFQIRDMIAWVYGSGFPKSLNIGKAVDKLQGNEREEFESKNVRPNSERGNGLAHGEYGKVWKETKGNLPWEGWGSQLKPALEPITVARKPLQGTVAQNVLKYGTGGMNIDGCRVGTSKRTPASPRKSTDDIYGKYEAQNTSMDGFNANIGRFPANFIHDGSDEVVRLLKDSARFFYTAKSSKSERNMNMEGMEEVVHNDGRDESLDSGNVPQNRSNNPKKNFHPTVKPVSLMQYLVRLVTPKDAICLDPFMGSGTMAIACMRENVKFIGIEIEPEYVKIANARISKVQPKLL